MRLADDYRYDHEAERIVVTLPSEVAARCVRLSHGLGLLFSGVDLRRTPDGRWCCFEVNPSPAYPYYEPPKEPVIAEALADLLSGRPSGPAADTTLPLDRPVSGHVVRGGRPRVA